MFKCVFADRNSKSSNKSVAIPDRIENEVIMIKTDVKQIYPF